MIYVSSGWAPSVTAYHPRIGWDAYNIQGNGIMSASTEAAGFDVNALENPLTYDKWKPTALPAWCALDIGDSSSGVNYVGIAAHTLEGFTVKIQSSTDNMAWTDRSDPQTPTDNSAILFLFNDVTARYWRVYITGTGIPSIGVVYFGEVLAVERAIYGGVTPITLSRQTIISNNKSDSGNWLGRSLIRRGLTGSAQFKNLSSTFYRTYFDPFVRSARQYPFFFAWRPTVFNDDIAYVWTPDDIAPQNNGTRALMDVSFDMMGFDGG